jgi:MraZ protein
VTFQGIKAESTETEWRARVRQISAQTFDITPDAQGRVSVPSVLLERVGITRRVKVIGMGNSMELWNPETFVADQKDLSEMDQDFMNKLF